MTSGKRILLVDDDEALRQTLAEQLQLHAECETVEATDGAAALARLREGTFAAVLVDIGLPDMDGRALCRTMREAGVRCPILLLAAAGADADAILGLEPAASDCLVKPLRLGVLLARLRAQLRLSEQREDDAIAIGPYRFHPTAKLLTGAGEEARIRLTEKEAAILAYLYRADGAVVGRETLLGEVWGYSEGVTTHTLETHVYRLRQKIERDPANAEILVTEPGGYRLVP